MNIKYSTSVNDSIQVARTELNNMYLKLKDYPDFLPLSLSLNVSNLKQDNLIEQKSNFVLKIDKAVEPDTFKKMLYSWTQEAFNDCVLGTSFLDKIEASGDDTIYGNITANSKIFDNKVQLFFDKIEDAA